jgi:hypothetical protein
MPLAYGLGSWLYLIAGPIPSIADPSFLLTPESAEFYPLAYLYAGLGLAAYFGGVALVRTRSSNVYLSTAQPSARILRALYVLYLAIFTFVWSMRYRLADVGLLSPYRSGITYEPTDLLTYLLYATLTLRWSLIPFCVFFLSRATGRMRMVWVALSSLEIGVYVLSSERTLFMVAFAQLVFLQAHFGRWYWRRLAVVCGFGILAFFTVINPAIIVARQAIWIGDRQGENQLSAMPGLLWQSLSSFTRGEDEELVQDAVNRDVKYRLNSLYFIAGMIGSEQNGTCEHGWGEYTLRNAASVVPRFLWPNKYDWAVANPKTSTELMRRLGITETDYIQSLAAHWFADFGWYGILFFVITGVVDQKLSNAIAKRSSYTMMLFIYLTVLPMLLAPVENFTEHFILRYREVGLLFGVLYLFERKLRLQESLRLRPKVQLLAGR